MSTNKLADPQWEKIYGFLQAQPNVYIGNEMGCRRFFEGIFWVFNSGSTWRSLPSEYGKWNSVFKRYTRWGNRGIFKAVFAEFKDDLEMPEFFFKAFRDDTA